MTGAFVASLVLLGALMKSVSLRCSRKPVGNRLFFILSPLVSVGSWRRTVRVTANAVLRSFGRSFLLTGAFLFGHWIYWRLVRTHGLSGWTLSYLGAPLVWWMGEAGGSIVRTLYLPSGRVMPLPHDHVPTARSLAEFWGRRWNLWFSDWFRQVFFRPLRAHPVTGLFLVFLVSGVIHEWVLNFNLWLITGHAPFGSMMLYFGLQPLGILFERRWLAHHPKANVCFAWLAVVGPVPWVVNEALLRILQLFVPYSGA